MEYVTYDTSTGEITGVYVQDLQATHNRNFVEVSSAQRQNWTSYKVDLENKTLKEYQVTSTNSQIPQSVPMRSARLVLFKNGLLGFVQSYIDNLAGEGAQEAKINWEFALTVERDNVLVKQLIPSLGKSEAEIDQMFIEASKL